MDAAEPGAGAHVRDLMRDEPLFLVDVGLGHTAPAGMVLAARLMAPDGIVMTTGAALPVGVLPAAGRDRLVQELQARGAGVEDRSPSAASERTATVLRTCLRHGAADAIAYVDPEQIPTARRPTLRIGRNEPCPCGSGKKFKKCCGSRE